MVISSGAAPSERSSPTRIDVRAQAKSQTDSQRGGHTQARKLAGLRDCNLVSKVPPSPSQQGTSARRCEGSHDKRWALNLTALVTGVCSGTAGELRSIDDFKESLVMQHLRKTGFQVERHARSFTERFEPKAGIFLHVQLLRWHDCQSASAWKIRMPPKRGPARHRPGF